VTAIDQTKAVDAIALLENVLRSADPEFTPQPQPSALHAALGGFVASREHKARAMAAGHNVDALLALARRQIFEIATTIKNIAATMPADDANVAALKTIIENLSGVSES
jgi:hypothetical protein